MKLPAPIFDLAKKHFACHGCWHRLRLIDSPEYQQLRDKCFPKGELWPNGLKAQGEKGCGEDFLRFHRMMIRNFKWVVKDAPAPKYQYLPWTDFPVWVASVLDALDPFYRQTLSQTLEYMIFNDSLDRLGQFIEGEVNDFPHIHFTVHGIVHDYEESHFGKQPESDMGYFETAPCNEHFWGLHGWIDEIYARWQRAHGEAVDQSPMVPNMNKMCPECEDRGGRKEFQNSWLLPWKQYLKVRSA